MCRTDQRLGIDARRVDYGCNESRGSRICGLRGRCVMFNISTLTENAIAKYTWLRGTCVLNDSSPVATDQRDDRTRHFHGGTGFAPRPGLVLDHPSD
jgi:hypothetical protein